MPSLAVSALTRDDIASAAKRFRGTRKMQKWSVIIDGREYPARPLVLEAAGVPPNDPTNSHQAIALLKSYGFEVRYLGKPAGDPADTQTQDDDFEVLLQKLRGSLKGRDALLKDREREHRNEKNWNTR
jgi:hypothetical protein